MDTDGVKILHGNVQFALNPDSFEYSVIEVNPRVSRSSALASKATGYPIAKVATKIALGYTLDEIRNDVTGKTFACFEPAIDYVVVKLPKWPFDKFLYAKRELGTRMKATGEVMAIGTSFEMAIMKAVRGAEISLTTLNLKKIPRFYRGGTFGKAAGKDGRAVVIVYRALKSGISEDTIFSITKIDRWFLHKLKHLVDYEAELDEIKKAEGKVSREIYERGKKLGYLDKDIAALSGSKITLSQKVRIQDGRYVRG